MDSAAREAEHRDVRPPAGAAGSSRRVLVVEDDPGLCDAIVRLARGAGSEVWEAQTLDEGLALLERSPDIVIADLRLAGRSSFPLIEAAVRRRPTPAVVAMSGQASAEESFRLGQLGVRAYLPKPFASDALIAAIERAVREAPALEAPVSSGAGGEDRARARAPGFGARLLCAARQAVARLVTGHRTDASRRARADRED